jgi:hypothetical protein
VSPPRRPIVEDTRIIHVLPARVDSLLVAAVGPDRTFAYKDADWQKIKQSLAWHDNIDADAVTVCYRWWAQPDPATAFTAAPQRPLREQLEALASDYRALSCWRKERRFLTPKQEAAEIQKVLNALGRARSILDESRVSYIAYEPGAVREELRTLTVKLERYRDELRTLGNRSSVNARKVHIAYWGELVSLWRAIAAGQAPRALNHFLYVCSAPAFPETTKGRIRSFLDQLH